MCIIDHVLTFNIQKIYCAQSFVVLVKQLECASIPKYWSTVLFIKKQGRREGNCDVRLSQRNDRWGNILKQTLKFDHTL